ncbi:MAG: ComEC/Rec2 family competence protein [Ktedonobacteraceae bacterium]
MQIFQTSSMKMTETEFSEPSSVRIAFLDVGQADTIVVTSPQTREAVVLDCVNPKAVLDYLKQEEILYLRGIIVTHLHADHYSGIIGLLENQHLVPGMSPCEVVAFNEVFNQGNLQRLCQDEDCHSLGYDGPSTTLSQLLEWRKQNKSRYATFQFQAGPLPITGTLIKSFQLLHPYAAEYRSLESKGLNNTSIVLRISTSGSSALLTGDIEPEGWQYLQANNPALQSDVLKFPHHGAWKNADAEKLIDGTQPSIVVISVGSEGFEKYQHPNAHVFDALIKRPHIRVLCTQATDQCRASVFSIRKDVLSKMGTQASKTGYPLPGSKKGCPCAGTVIIELSDHARVLQPEIHFHREGIIKTYFTSHKCNI